MRDHNAFIHTFIDSLFPQPTPYKNFLGRPFIFSLKYITMLFFILTIGSGIAIILTHAQGLGIILNKPAFTQAIDAIPPDFHIELFRKTLATNYQHPYFMWLRGGVYPKALLVIDEFGTPAKINEYQSVVLLSAHDVTIMSPSIRFNYPSFPISISQKDIFQNREKLLFFYSLIPICIVFYLFIIKPAIIIITTGVILILFSFLFELIFQKKNIKAKDILQLSLHSSTIPLFVLYLIDIFSLQFSTTVFAILLGIFLVSTIYEVFLYKKTS